MVAVNKKLASSKRNLNSGVLLSILKLPTLTSDVARQVIEEWCKHVSWISKLLSFCVTLAFFPC